MTSPDHDDRRVASRYPANVPVRVRRVQPEGYPGPWLDGQIVNASESGVFVESAAPFCWGEPLDAELPLQDGPEVVRAVVIWTRSDDPRGIAVRFLDLSPAMVELIRHELESGRWIAGDRGRKQRSASGVFLADLSDLGNE